MRGGYLSGFVVAAVVCEVLWRVLSCRRGGNLYSVVVGFVDDNRA
jgi:hypothetical protein